MRSNTPATEALAQKPVTETIQKMAQRPASQLPQRPGSFKYMFQIHDNLLSLPRLSRQPKGCHSIGIMCSNIGRKHLKGANSKRKTKLNFT
jgi:hypothetical protein